jgi:hypothetical protein
VAGVVKRIGRDRFRLRLGAEEIALLRSLPEQLRSVLTGPGAEVEQSTGLFGDAARGPEDAPAGPEPEETGPEDLPADSGERTGGPGSGAADRQDMGADPVLERLFPRAYLEPEDVNRDAEYQRLVRDDLLEAKLANLDVITRTLDRGTASLRRWTVDLTEDEAASWLGALNDLRLALGVRLGITEDFDGDVDPADPQAPALNVLSYLGWLEENLVDALSSG